MLPVQSDIRILDKLLALNLSVSLWSARRKMTAENTLCKRSATTDCNAESIDVCLFQNGFKELFTDVYSCKCF